MDETGALDVLWGSPFIGSQPSGDDICSGDHVWVIMTARLDANNAPESTI